MARKSKACVTASSQFLRQYCFLLFFDIFLEPLKAQNTLDGMKLTFFFILRKVMQKYVAGKF